MSDNGAIVVIGGTSGIGREAARHYAEQGRSVVLTGRDPDKADMVANEVGRNTIGVALDLTKPYGIAAAMADIGPVRHLVLAAIMRDQNTIAEYDLASALELVTLKLIGYTEVVHVLTNRLLSDGSIVILGGQALRRPYPGSTTISTVNGGIVGMVHTLAVELAPIRTNALHPGIVADSPYWHARPPTTLEAIADRTPTKRLPTMSDIVDAIVFLLENPSVNGEELTVDGGWILL
jgi:NAD(P)-dependent dehydrogenase (short-subunit alcohol dehydrogenase family)